MSRKTRIVRVPVEAWEGFMKKKSMFEKIAQQERLKQKITFADTLRFYGQKPIFIYNDELINYFKGKKKRNKNIFGGLNA